MPAKNGCVGLDIGGTKILMMISSNERIIYERQVPSDSRVEKLFALIDEGVEKSGVTDIEAIAAGVPGIISRDGQEVVDAPALGWRSLRLLEMIRTKYRCPCAVDNDVTMAMTAEMGQGVLKGKHNGIMITIGTGLGCSILTNGSIVHGDNNSAGEIGYCNFCDCGQTSLMNKAGAFGSLESQLSGSYLHQAALSLGADPKLLLSSPCTPEEKDVSDSFLSLLAVTIANLVNILDPGVVVLGGGVAESLKDILPRLEDRVRECTPIPVKIHLSDFLNRAGAIGACIRAEALGAS